MKLSKYSEFYRKVYEWYHFSDNFEATVEADGLGELFIYNYLDEEDHLEKRDYDPKYNSKIKKFYDILKNIVLNGSDNSKVRNFNKNKYVILAYLYLRQ